MKDLFNAGQVLGRLEMKKIMAGSGGGSCKIGFECTCGGESKGCYVSYCKCLADCGQCGSHATTGCNNLAPC